MLDGLTILILILLAIFIISLIIWFFTKDNNKKKEKFYFSSGDKTSIYAQSNLAGEASQGGGVSVPYPTRLEWDGNPSTQASKDGYFPRPGGFSANQSLGNQLSYRLQDKDQVTNGKENFEYKLLVTKDGGDLELVSRQVILQNVYNMFYSIQIFYEHIHDWAEKITNRVNNITNSKLSQLGDAIDRLEIYLWGTSQKPRAEPRSGSGGNRDLEQKLMALFAKSSSSTSSVVDFGYDNLKGISQIDGRYFRLYKNANAYTVDNTSGSDDIITGINQEYLNSLVRLHEGRFVCYLYSPVTATDTSSQSPPTNDVTGLRALTRNKDNNQVFFFNNTYNQTLMMISRAPQIDDSESISWLNKTVLTS